MSQYDTLSRHINAASCYDTLSKPVDDAIIPFDERVRLEDQIKLRFLSLARAADDKTFASLIRRVRDDRPRWMQRDVLNDMVTEEISMRALVAKATSM